MKNSVESVAAEIQLTIGKIEKTLDTIKEYADKKATTIAEYEKALSIAVLRLKTEGEYVSVIDRLARGDCWKQKLEADKAESYYRNAIKGLEAFEAILNGWQSIFRHLEGKVKT